MKLPRRRFLRLAAGAAALPTVSRVGRAQTYPSRPITMIVPFPPGGLTDVLGRVLAAGMQTLLVQSVVVENVGGASGSIGTGRVARAAPDGYTVVLGIWNTHCANGVTYTLDYDVVKDFVPIVLCAEIPLVLVAKKALPAHDLQSYIAWLKTNPGKASMGTVGVGSRPAPRHLDAKGDRHTIYFGALSWRRTLGAGPCGRADRHDVHQHGHRTAVRARRQHKSSWPDVPETDGSGT
jgi:tripartite-type tricarboxylate transporter receptor subunit TctC